MSLLSSRLRIALTPGRVALGAGRDYREAAVAEPGWAGALQALSGLLAGSGVQGRASVVLSHHFAPVQMLQSPSVALKPLEMQGWIRDQLARQFGESGRDWHVAWQPEPPGEPFLVSSFEPARLAELGSVLRAASLKLVELQPWLAPAWNRQRRRVARGHAWYALVEPGRLTLLGLKEGRLHSLRTTLMQDDAVVDALANLLTREALLAGETTPAPLWIESAVLRPNWKELGGSRSVHLVASGRDPLAALLEN